jgi:hypothetical protein
MKYRCRDDETNPYNPNDEDWTPTNLQLRYCVEELMVTVASCIQRIGELTGEDLPTDADELKKFVQRKNTDKIVH